MSRFGPDRNKLQNGERIACEKCGKSTEVRWFPNKKLVVATQAEREILALRCQSCGFITCNDCAHPNDSIFPVCPNCGREWGPYYFLRNEGDSDDGENEEPSEPVPVHTLSWEDRLRMDLPPAAMPVGSPDTDSPQAENERPLGRLRLFGRVRSSPWMLLIFILIGVLCMGSILLMLRLPAISNALQSRDTATPMALDNLDNTTQTPILSENQIVSVEGQVILPPNLDDCQQSDNGFNWCPLNVQADNSTPVWVRQGNTANSLSSSLQLLSNNGTRIPNFSQVSVQANVRCSSPDDCRFEAEKIILLEAATAVPTAAPATITPTPRPSATTGPTRTVTPTESLCKDALKITLDDLDRELCVQGIVFELFEQETGVTVLFDNQPGTFAFVSYGPPVDFAKEGICVVASGPVQRLGNRPVIVVQYARPLEVCP